MQRISGMPVAQALQRHSGGWKPSPTTDEPTREPSAREREPTHLSEQTTSDAPSDR